MWFVYILRCSDDSLYTGVTTNLSRRVNEHNNSNKGAKYTRTRQPVQLVWSAECGSRSEAMKREASIKKLNRPKKLLLVNNKI
jgi:putative endonuclease